MPNLNNLLAYLGTMPEVLTTDDVHADFLNNYLKQLFSNDKLLMERGGQTGRNLLLKGPYSTEGLAVAIIKDLVTTGQITIQAATLISFAAGININGPLDYLYQIPADVTIALPAADAQTIPLSYTDDLCNGGTAISGGDQGIYGASRAFDNDNVTCWNGAQYASNQAGNSAIGYDFGSAKSIRRIKLANYSSATYTMPTAKVQYSTNGTVWVDAATLALSTVGSDINYINVPAVGAYRYWRLLATSNIGAYSWTVPEIEMYEALQTHYIHATRATDGSVTYASTRQKPKTGKPSQSINTSVGTYTANLCTGGTAISTGDYPEYSKDYAFDASTTTKWVGLGAVNGVAAIGYNFGHAVHIRKINLLQNTIASDASILSSVKVQRSSDGNAWTDVMTSPVNNNVTDILLPVSVASNYWRLLANSNATVSANWDVLNIEMMEYIPPVTTVSTDDLIYTDNVAVGGAAISSGDAASYPKENAFDGVNSSVWKSATGTAYTTRYIGYDLGVARAIKRAVFTCVVFANSAKLQYSTDGATWNDAQTFNVVSGFNTVILGATNTARYWRVLGNSTTRTDGGTDTASSLVVNNLTLHEIGTDLNHYDPVQGVSRHYDGTNWTIVVRKILGEAVVDSAGKIVSATTYPYGLANLVALPAVGVDDVVTLGQLTASLLANGWVKIPVMFNGIAVEFILQWGTFITNAGTAATVTFPIAFPSACIHANIVHASDGVSSNGYMVRPANVTKLGMSKYLDGWSSGVNPVCVHYWVSLGY